MSDGSIPIAPDSRSKKARLEAVDAANEQIKAVDALIAVAELRLKALRLQRVTAEKDRAQACTHPTIEKKSYYDRGSYDTMASTEFWNECTVCGAKSETWSKSHGYYG